MGLKIILDTKDAVRAADEFAKAVDRVRKAVGVAGTEADKFQKKTDGMSRRFGSAGKSAEAAAAKVDKFNAALRNTPAQAQKVTVAVQRMGAASAASSGQLQTLVRQFLGFAAARKVVTTIADLESGLVTLGTVTGKTGKDLEELKDTAVEVARQTRFTPEETIGALLSLSRAGQDAATAAESLISVTQLAQAGVTSLGQAADLTAATIAQFSSQGVDAAKAASTLVATADRTKSTVLSLGASLAQAGQAAATFGVSLSETAAVAGVLQDSGVQASRAGRAIKTILAQLASAGERSEASRESLRKLGLEIGDVLPSKTQKFTDVLRNLREGLSQLGGEERTNILRNLVGKDFFAVLSAAIDGIEKIDRVSAISADSIGELTEKADRQNATLAASIRGVGSAFQEVLIDADSARSSLKGFFDDLASSIRVIGGADVEIGEITDSVKTLSLAIKGIAFAGAAAGIRAIATALTATPWGLFVAGAAAAAVALEEVVKQSLGVSDSLAAFRRELIKASEDSDRIRREFDNTLGSTAQENIAGAIKLLDDFVRTGKNGAETVESIQKAFGGLKDSTQDVERIIGGRAFSFLSGSAGTFQGLEGLDQAVERLKDIQSESGLVGRALSEAFSDVTSSVGSALASQGKTINNAGLENLERLFGLSPDRLRSALDSNLKLYVDEIKSFGELLRRKAQSEASNAAKSLRQEFGALVTPDEGGGGLGPAAGFAGGAGSFAGSSGGDIDSSVAFQLKNKLALLREEATIRRTSLELKQSILAGEVRSEDIQKTLVDQIAERIALEEGIEEGDKEALTAARAIAEIEAERTRQKAEQLLLTQLQAAEDKKFREENRKISSDAARRKKKADAEALANAKTLEEIQNSLIEAELKASGDKEGLKLFQREQAAGDLVGSDREQALAMLERTQELEEQMKKEEALRQTLAAGLQTFVGTLIQSNGDLKSALESLVQSIAQGFIQEGTQNLAKGLSGALFGVATGGAAPQQVGGIIPAQAGQIMNSPTKLMRGGRTYSVAEGGGSTPEAVMPLMRDSRGRLGVAGGGGASTNITMNFPNVQTTQEARAMRSSMRQQVAGILGSQGQSRGARNKK